MENPTAIEYRLSVPNPRSHYFHLEVSFPTPEPGIFVVALPVWTPGSYLVREYARHLIHLQALADDQEVAVISRDKASWEVHVPPNIHRLTLSYDVYAYELTVRTSFLDQDYGLAQGTALFLYHPTWQDRPVTLELALPDGWSSASGL
ncbi:MAG: M61 family peptidase, partial [Sulfobacillus thermotolerans]|nr:M61 family peptidase [Sulfobacillus thermotolerans]